MIVAWAAFKLFSSSAFLPVS